MIEPNCFFFFFFFFFFLLFFSGNLLAYATLRVKSFLKSPTKRVYHRFFSLVFKDLHTTTYSGCIKKTPQHIVCLSYIPLHLVVEKVLDTSGSVCHIKGGKR